MGHLRVRVEGPSFSFVDMYSVQRMHGRCSKALVYLDSPRQSLQVKRVKVTSQSTRMLGLQITSRQSGNDR